jgi:hypothetical protein
MESRRRIDVLLSRGDSYGVTGFESTSCYREVTPMESRLRIDLLLSRDNSL